MSGYDLPTSLEFGGREWEIRSDYRAVLDVLQVLGDSELDDGQRQHLVLDIFYPDSDAIPRRDLQEALEALMWFIGGGRPPEGGNKPRIMDWEQDFPLIVAPVNRVLGTEIRAIDYLHWWSFLAAYNEIGDCLFAQVVSIRKKRAAGKKLDKSDERFYRENRDLVELRKKETAEEAALVDEWIG